MSSINGIPQMVMTLLGQVTPKNVIHKIESHKLMNAFPVATGKTILEGQPVVLEVDGTIKGYENGDSLDAIIGYAITGSATAAYTASNQRGAIEVTVAVKGYAIVYGIAAVAIDAGPIKPNGALDSTSRYAAYIQAVAAISPAAGVGYTYTAADLITAIALNPAEEGELIQILVL